MFRLPENSFSTRIFHSCHQLKLSHTGSYYHTPPQKSSSPSSRKGGGNYVGLQISVKIFPPGLILDIDPFRFCCIFKLQNCTLFRRVSFSICPIFTNIPFLIHTITSLSLSKICTAHMYFAVLNSH